MPSDDTVPLMLPTRIPERPLWLGHTPAMRHVGREILALAHTEKTSALILGENGTGKELVAEAIHVASRRASRPFIPVNCGGIPAKLAEAELFGTDPGAFTDAIYRRGAVELAHSGTLFLDEIGELPLSLQPTLLRFLQTQQFRHLGGERELAADVRVVAATLRDLPLAMATGTFRPDLFYRLNVFIITLPPLRERLIDLPDLISHTLAERAKSLGLMTTPACDEATQVLLMAYPWPGNLRQLRNVLERAIILNDGATILPAHLPETIQHFQSQPPPAPPLAEQLAALNLPPTGVDLPELVRFLEDRLIAQAMTRTQHNQSRAATLLGLTRDQLRQRLKRGEQES
jgi:DNA-binding NtrC family response regulator